MNTKLPKEAEAFATGSVYLQRTRLVGPMALRQQVLAALKAARFRVLRDEPYTDKFMKPRVDETRFLLEVERRVG